MVCFARSSLQIGSRCAWYLPFSFFQSPLYREWISVLSSLWVTGFCVCDPGFDSRLVLGDFTGSSHTFHFSPKLCASTSGCSPPSTPSVVVCLLLPCSRWFPSSLLCRLAIFYVVVPLIFSLSLVATLCSVWSTYCPSFLLYVRPISMPGPFSIMTTIFVPFLISEHGTICDPPPRNEW